MCSRQRQKEDEEKSFCDLLIRSFSFGISIVPLSTHNLPCNDCLNRPDSASPMMLQTAATAKRAISIVLAVFVTLIIVFLHSRRDRLIVLAPLPLPAVRPAMGRSGQQRSLLDDIGNSTLGFEKVFVVGLPSRTDRRDGITLAAALGNLQIEFKEGVVASEVAGRAIPKNKEMKYLQGAVLGSWRGHMNAMQEVVRRNLESVLILEDDVDWDIRLKDQLRDFARASNALLQPLRDSPHHYADPTYPRPSSDSSPPPQDIPFEDLPATLLPTTSPYGDDWDVLWIGHCGMHFPFDGNDIPKGRVIHRRDVTVAPKKSLWVFNSPFTLKDKYPDHTRAVHHVQEGVCTLGYAVSQSGARKILFEIAQKPPTDAFDILLRFFCEGTEGRAMHNCLTLTPGLFHHYRPAGPVKELSDIGDHGDAFRERPDSDIVRWSVRLNTRELLDGGTGFVDQFPDEE
ncbi:hypothetical protein DCS_01703 [Drechmeria coniospora]|uniref:Glycosyl transferase family 25 domain-containing protein n=1 Tax=Drechmeria coniospora TaxID=98403 RepID=A0A151GTW5_DRECN|nr:hypothetical protein DCS_01703 [Drechmeria coniospora]KYK60566.1 hypothetical protein DCS_01703 [Drechmeria coniospora]ODA80721.1 hypothetical protein RJ55_03680 [Drechmeria coniospora]